MLPHRCGPLPSILFAQQPQSLELSRAGDRAKCMLDARTFALGLGAGIAVSWVAFKYYGGFKAFSSPALAARATKNQGAASIRGGDGGAKPQGGAGARVPMSQVLDDEVLREQLTRNIQFFGERSQLDLANAFVVVVGLGGVGSHAAHFLLRSGIGKLRLVDFDQVTLSSLNRHALATRADVGLPKATCLKDRFSEICPECEVEAMVSLFDDATKEDVLEGKPDFVVDAIDNIHTKVQLLVECKTRGIEVLCVCGAGGKADPTRLKIADIAESTIDPLGRAVRYQLKNKYKFTGEIPALFSTEQPRCGLLPFDEDQGNPLDYQVVPNFRVRTIPVLGTTPAIFGMAAAAYVLTFLTGSPLVPEPAVLVRLREVETLYERLKDREGDDCWVDLDECEYCIRSVWGGCCACVMAKGPAEAAKRNKGLWRNTRQLTLARWREDEACLLENLVLLSFGRAEELEQEGRAEFARRHPGEAAFIERRLGTLRKFLS